MKSRSTSLTALCILQSALCLVANAQPTNFTYQGRLADGGVPANGIYDFQFVIYNGPNSGAPGISALQTTEAMDLAVSNGLFAAEIPFQSWVFNGEQRWLAVQVRTNDSGDYTGLVPWTEITPAPYAVRALNVTSNALMGEYGEMVSFSNPANAFVGDGSGLTGVTLDGATTADFWQLGGNAGTTAEVDFIGTTDNQPLELKVNSTRGWRLEPTVNDADHSGIINVVSGSPANVVAPGVYGAAISGGGASNYLSASLPNRVDADFGSIGGGMGNTIQAGAVKATVGGGQENTVRQGSLGVTIAGGRYNTIGPNTLHAVMGGGYFNLIGSNSIAGTISGGGANSIGDAALSTVIGGGTANSIGSGASFSTLAGGISNAIAMSSQSSVVGGGRLNSIGVDSDYNTIGGGFANDIADGAEYSVIPGGSSNAVGAAASGAFAAGNRAKANHAGSFVWADSQNTDFESTTNDQFAVRAENGVMIQSTNTAIDLRGGGRIRVEGAGIGTSTAVFIHRATTGNITANWTTIDHPHSNGDPNAILIVTPSYNPGGTLPSTYNNHPIGVYYAGGKWTIFNQDQAAMAVNSAFNVLIFKR